MRTQNYCFMITIQTNITTEKFLNAYAEPIPNNNYEKGYIPSGTFIREDDNFGDYITRRIDWEPVPERPFFTIIVFREFIQEGTKYVEEYRLKIGVDNKKPNLYKDDYIYLYLDNVNILNVRKYKPVNIQNGLDEIRKYGYDFAKEEFSHWMESMENEDDPEEREYVLDENGLIKLDMFLDHINAIFWDFEFDYFKKKISTKKVARFYGSKLGHIFFEGVDKFAIEAYNIKL